MRSGRYTWMKGLFPLGSIAAALLIVSGLLLCVGAPPLEALRQLTVGSVGSVNKISDVLVVWVPLLLVTSGLLATFAAGLWNIGIEGQITAGAIFSTWILRLLQDSTLPPGLVIVLAFLAGMMGGALWAAMAGVLKTYGGVNEIFGGLGLNFVANTVTLWLIFGPWKRPGTGSMSGTEPFAESFWLPQMAGLRLSGWALALGLVGLVIIYFLLRGTHFGLKLKATGKNARAAFILGVPVNLYMMCSFLICGALAGAAGSVQVTAVYHRLIPSISSGYGYLGLMIAMLANYQAGWVALVAIFFAAINIGSIQLPIVLKLDSSLSGVLQGILVLVVLMMNGVRQRWARNPEGPK